MALKKTSSKKDLPKAQKGKNVNFKSSNYWADDYSLDTNGLAKGKSNYYPYERSNGTKGVVTTKEAKQIVKDVKSGKLQKSDYYKKSGGAIKAKTKK
jgi:hypothetical protein